MKILITGSNGQLGRALQKVLPGQNCVFTTRADFDITDGKQAIQQITVARPSIVIHTAAYTDVEGCEKNPKLARQVNFEGTRNLALACQKIRATMVYISTDYVFDGQKNKPYQEDDQPNPINIYGQIKLAGEKAVQNICPKYLIVRTAWLFGEGRNFVQTILKLAKEKKTLKVVNDQVGSPSYALDLARTICKLIYGLRIMNYEPKIFHITNSGQCSWYEFAREIIRLAALEAEILPISSSQWQAIKPGSVKRPKYSVLDCSNIQKLGLKMRSWQEALREYLRISWNTQR